MARGGAHPTVAVHQQYMIRMRRLMYPEFLPSQYMHNYKRVIPKIAWIQITHHKLSDDMGSEKTQYRSPGHWVQFQGPAIATVI